MIQLGFGEIIADWVWHPIFLWKNSAWEKEKEQSEIAYLRNYERKNKSEMAELLSYFQNKIWNNWWLLNNAATWIVEMKVKSQSG
jgi:hypothetical protein